VGVTCNATTFTAAETIATSLNLKVGGGIVNETEAIDLREQWKLACRCAELTKGASGWEIVIPEYESTTDADFTDSNITYKGRGESKASAFVNNVTVSYYYDYKENSYLKTNEKSCSKAYGTDKAYKLQLVNDDETASRIAQYIRNSFLYGDETLECETGRDGSALLEGNILGITTTKPSLTDARYKIKTISRSKSKVGLSLSEYSTDIFTWVDDSADYEPAPPDPETIATAPAIPSGFATTNIVDGIKLSWTHNTEEDFKEYEIYRDGVYYKTTKTNIFNDLTFAYSTLYTYKIRAKGNSALYSDYTGNETGTAQKATEATNITLDYPTSTLNTSITQNAGQILLRVTKTGLNAEISSLSITPANITMASGSITMNTSGTVTINSSDGLEITSNGDLLFTDVVKLNSTYTATYAIFYINPQNVATNDWFSVGTSGNRFDSLALYGNSLYLSSGTGKNEIVGKNISLEPGASAGDDLYMKLPKLKNGTGAKAWYRLWWNDLLKQIECEVETPPA